MDRSKQSYDHGRPIGPVEEGVQRDANRINDIVRYDIELSSIALKQGTSSIVNKLIPGDTVCLEGIVEDGAGDEFNRVSRDDDMLGFHSDGDAPGISGEDVYFKIINDQNGGVLDIVRFNPENGEVGDSVLREGEIYGREALDGILLGLELIRDEEGYKDFYIKGNLNPKALDLGSETVDGGDINCTITPSEIAVTRISSYSRAGRKGFVVEFDMVEGANVDPDARRYMYTRITFDRLGEVRAFSTGVYDSNNGEDFDKDSALRELGSGEKVIDQIKEHLEHCGEGPENEEILKLIEEAKKYQGDF